MGLFVLLSSLKNLPNQLVKWKVVFLLCLTTLLIVYVTVLCLSPIAPVLPFDQSKRNQSINQFHRPKTKIIFMNKTLCVSPAIKNNSERTAVILVLSARNNFNHRSLVRQTYGSVKYANNVRILALVFILANSATPANDDANVKKLQAENEQFGDIIMGDFIDSYRNLTLKTIMAFEWLTEHCRQAQIVVKTDDDVVVNIFELTKQLHALSPADMVSSNIWGWIHKDEQTVKNVTSRFYAALVDYPSGKFPDHCGGVGYVTPFRVVERILDDISTSYPRRVSTHEDVFITGVVPAHINSMASYSWRPAAPIKLVNKPETVSYVFQSGRDDKDEFLRNFVKNTTMDANITNFNTFRERNPNRIFFLLSHSKEFDSIYLRLWHIIKTTFGT